jgi:uncharacterized membrane protein HdeD (DUF308 family)
MTNQNKPGGNILLITGVFLTLFGFLAIVSPAVAGTAVIRIIAIVLIGTGVVQVFQSIRVEGTANKIISSALGLITAGLGLMVWMNPEVGSAFLTALLMIYFVAQGIWKMSASRRYKRSPAWFWLFLSGLLSLGFAYLLWRQWPLSGAWAIGIFVGLDLLLTGVALILVAMTIKKAGKTGSLDTISL